MFPLVLRVLAAAVIACPVLFNRRDWRVGGGIVVGSISMDSHRNKFKWRRIHSWVYQYNCCYSYGMIFKYSYILTIVAWVL